MKKFAIRGMIFLSILFVVDKPIGWIISGLAQQRQYDNRIGKLGRKEIRTDLVVLGSSRAINDIDAGLLESLTGMRCYGLGFSGSNIRFHLSVLRMLIQNCIPKKVVLTVDHGSAFIHSEISVFRKDLLYPFTRYPPVYRELCSATKKNYFLGQLFWIYRENNNFYDALVYLKSGKMTPDLTSDIDEHGSIMIEERSPAFKSFAHFERFRKAQNERESPELLASLDSILSICLQNGVELYVVLPPSHLEDDQRFHHHLDTLIGGRARLLDMSRFSLVREFYFDSGHLNKKGAQILTRELYNRLRDAV